MPRRAVRPDTLLRVSAKVAAVIALVGGAGCSSDDPPSPSISSQPTLTATTVASDASVVGPISVVATVADASPTGSTADVVEYCEQVVRLSGERAESYIGSAEQRVDVGTLLDVAPKELMAPLTTFSEFLDSGAITAEDPESNVVENWPPAVQNAIREIRTYNEASC